MAIWHGYILQDPPLTKQLIILTKILWPVSVRHGSTGFNNLTQTFQRFLFPWWKTLFFSFLFPVVWVLSGSSHNQIDGILESYDNGIYMHLNVFSCLLSWAQFCDGRSVTFSCIIKSHSMKTPVCRSSRESMGWSLPIDSKRLPNFYIHMNENVPYVTSHNWNPTWSHAQHDHNTSILDARQMKG